SSATVPLIVGDQVRGTIQLMDMEREHAFSESDVRLLQTLASSMSVALENARLFDETQRLYKESEQRAAELAIINGVQQGLVSKLDMQAIYTLVGDKIRDIFHADTTLIGYRDGDEVVVPYYVDRGETPEGVTAVERRRPYGKGLAESCLESGKPLLLGTRQER